MLERIWLLEVSALDENNNPTTLRFASGDYTSPDGFYYENRLKQPALFTISAYTGSVLQSSSRSGFGESVLVNLDGGLDYLADYAVDGRTSLLKLRDENNVITTVINGTVESLAFEARSISVRIRDPQEVLAISHPQQTYAGTNVLPNGLEGTANDIKGQNKPKVFGSVSNISPVLVNTSKLIYEFDSNASAKVTAVYDRGVPLTLNNIHTTESTFINENVPSGKYDTYAGYIRLGSTPVGTVTMDAKADVTLAGDVFKKIAAEVAYSVLETDVDNVNTIGEVGIYLQNSQSTASLFDLIASSIGGYWSVDGNEQLNIKQLMAPINPTIVIEPYQILDVNRTSTGAGSNRIPVYKVVFRADKVETTQNDLAGAVSDTFRARVSSQYREAITENMITRGRHPLSEELVVDTCLRSLDVATQQSARIQNLFGVRRDSVTVDVRFDAETAAAIKIGTVVELRTYKYGYGEVDDGRSPLDQRRNFVVLGYTLDARLSKASLELFGASTEFSDSLLVNNLMDKLKVDAQGNTLKALVGRFRAEHLLKINAEGDYLAVNILKDGLRTM